MFYTIIVALLLTEFATSLCGQQVCARCHAREAENYARTAMARSSGTPEGQPGGRVVHKLSGSLVVIRSDTRGMTHTLEESGLKAEYPVAYFVGAGIVGRSYLVRVGDYLFQSPVSYYTKTKGWDLTPGYEGEHRLDFDHEIVSGCLFCHAGSIYLLGKSNNRYQDPAFTPISCERCHGDGSAHIQSPSSRNIVNPAKLAARARDSICEQCHLEGAVRILDPGKDWWNFQAGQDLEKTFSVYLERDATGLKAVSHVEQLGQSKCARMSAGRLWCGTCHDPHGDLVADRKRQIRDICTSCHSQLSPASHPQSIAECTSCHMPSRNATNVAHAAVTDHRILRRPALQLTTVGAGVEAQPPVAWRDPQPPIDRRNLGLACLELARDHRSLALAQEAAHLLSTLRPEAAEDPEVLTALGSLCLQQRRNKEALKMFAEAAQKEPFDATNALREAIAYEADRAEGGAIKALEQAIRLDPSLERAYFELARLYGELGEPAPQVRILRRYVELFPESIKGRIELNEMIVDSAPR